MDEGVSLSDSDRLIVDTLELTELILEALVLEGLAFEVLDPEKLSIDRLVAVLGVEGFEPEDPLGLDALWLEGSKTVELERSRMNEPDSVSTVLVEPESADTEL